MKTKMMLLTLGFLLMSGCSTMNDRFSCNQTAGDSCLSIDEVHAMTEPDGMYSKQPVFKDSVPFEKDQNMAGTLWIAPHKDAYGQLLSEKSIPLNNNKGRG